jgi:hypothetical protein
MSNPTEETPMPEPAKTEIDSGLNNELGAQQPTTMERDYPEFAGYLKTGQSDEPKSNTEPSILDAIEAALQVGFTLNEQETWEDWEIPPATGPEPDFPPGAEPLPEHKKHPELADAAEFLGMAILRRIKHHHLSPTTRSAHEAELRIIDLMTLEEQEIYLSLRPAHLPLGAPLGSPKNWQSP